MRNLDGEVVWDRLLYDGHGARETPWHGIEVVECLRIGFAALEEGETE